MIAPLMKRTSLSLSNKLYNRLQIIADNKGMSMSGVIRNLIEKTIDLEEKSKLEETYRQLRKIRAIAKSDSSKTSQEIDEILYGGK